MDENDTIIVDDELVKDLENEIVIRENINLKDKTYSDAQMVKWIKEKIEEEVKIC